MWYIQVTLNQPEPGQALGAQPEDITVGTECVLHAKLQLEQDLNNYFKVTFFFFFFFFSDSACSPSVTVLRPKALHNPLARY